MKQLSKENLKIIIEEAVYLPGDTIFELPERLLQFGTGVLLRGLPDYIIDHANRKGIFNGRIVVVKSTAAGGIDDFAVQDNLYTLHIEGVDEGEAVDKEIICSAIRRVISACDDWTSVLKVAHNPELQIVVSNTTEAGIQLVEESIIGRMPDSFPAKLLAVLYERFEVLGGTEASGLIIIPTELIVDNGKVLRSIVLELAQFNGLEKSFIDWLNKHNHFCDSLVDRIVSGKPDFTRLTDLQLRSGYIDNLRITAEPYYLWAIEGDEHIREKLSFSQVNKGVVIEDNIRLHRN